MDTVGKRLSYAIKKNNIKVKTLSEITGFCEISLYRYMRDEVVPRMDTFLQLADALNVDVEWLMRGDTMKRMARFEKVPFDVFREADEKNRTLPEKSWKEAYKKITIPVRATAGSAGYDFISPYTFTLEPGEEITLATGIRVEMQNGYFLMCVPKSGLGFKYGVRLKNTVGIIDADYYHSDNMGQISAKIVNGGDKPMTIEAGKAFMQAIFVPFGITIDDAAEGIRNGGFGSTGK